MQNAMIIDSRDNVIVAIEPIAKGDTVTWMCDGKENTLTALQDITIYHKIACRDIVKGMPVIKYGEHIGIAVADIKLVNMFISITLKGIEKTWKLK